MGGSGGALERSDRALEGLDGSLGGSKEVRGGLMGPCGTKKAPHEGHIKGQDSTLGGSGKEFGVLDGACGVQNGV